MTRIIVFAKAPVPGRVKTRLIPTLGADGAAALALEMLQRTLDISLSSRIGEVELCMDPAPDDSAWQDIMLPPDIRLSSQSAGDLGERMARAVSLCIDRTPVILIGTDCVDMNKALLREAANALATADAVINPCIDGGYALLGLNRFHPSLFENIAWSTSSVTSRTLARLEALGWRVHVGREVRDVDSPRDLDDWYRKLALSAGGC